MADWRHHAACKDLPPDLFFSDGKPFREAVDACSGCEVVIPCFFNAIRTPGLGYQAGMSSAERIRVRRWDRQARARASVS
jgi:WhiB family redox-sensing transcriptional regulator